jgi:hypothetical protein
MLLHLSQRGWSQAFVALVAAAISVVFFSFSPLQVAVAGTCAAVVAAGAAPLLFDAVHYVVAFYSSAPDARPPWWTAWTRTRLQRWGGWTTFALLALACGVCVLCELQPSECERSFCGFCAVPVQFGLFRLGRAAMWAPGGG